MDGVRTFWRKRVLRPLLDVVFPITCVGCNTYAVTEQKMEDGTPAAEQWLCEVCRSKITPDRPACVVCGSGAPTGRTCYSCLRKTSLTGTLALGPYHDPVLRAAITLLKFRGVRELAGALGALLARRIAAAGLTQNAERSVLVPIPLHRRRERQRGFNQTALLAAAVSARLGCPVVPLLVRRRATAAQTSIWGSSHARNANVGDAFAIAPRQTLPECSRVILIDDVLTTGATAAAAAQALQPLGTLEIWAGVVARG